MKRKLNRFVQATFYILGGVYHFINPEIYLELIPSYMLLPEAINYSAGFAEISLGIGLLFRRSSKIAAFGILLMLIAFIPSHIYFIQIGGCVHDGLCVPDWVSWVRLIVVHPLLMYWALSARRG